MKRISLMIIATVAFALLVYAQSLHPQQASPLVNQVKVTAKTISGLSANNKFVVDLTRKATVYEFNPAVGKIDFDRIVLRTAKGEQSLRQAFGSARLTGWGAQTFRLGATADGKSVWNPQQPLPTTTAQPAKFTCVDKYCDCKGALDCGNMILSGMCGTWVACTSNGQCICEVKR